MPFTTEKENYVIIMSVLGAFNLGSTTAMITLFNGLGSSSSLKSIYN